VPSGVNLAGTWKLDRALSDDPEKIYGKILKQRAERYAEQTGAPPPRGGANPDAADPNNPLSAEAQAATIIGASHLDPFDMGVFGTIPRGDVITIRQRPDEMYMSDGTTNRSFTPGVKSVVSVPEGVADQHSGWTAHLLADIQSHGGNLPSIKIKRVYDRLGGGLNVAPTND
jgi:hypothetical protein